MTTWDASQYLGFEDHRMRPAIDLLSRIDFRSPSTIWDLGCGTGNVTNLIRRRWPDASVSGLDSSPEMLDRAAEIHGVEWILGDIDSWRPDRPVDLIYTNAALHWVPDHHRLFPHLVQQLSTGGVLAVQMPRNFSEPSHTCLRQLAESPEWSERMTGIVGAIPVAEPCIYYDILEPIVERLDIWETIYQQVLEGEDPVANWTAGTAASPFLDRLDGADRTRFLDQYAAMLADAYPRRTDGSTLFPFRRLFLIAHN